MSPEHNRTDLYRGISKFIDKYNNHRPHQGIDNKIPMELYKPSAQAA